MVQLCLLINEKLKRHFRSYIMDKLNQRSFQIMTGREKKCIFTDPFVRVRGTGDKLQHFRSLLSQTPAIEDFSIAFLKVIKLLGISRIQEPGKKFKRFPVSSLQKKMSLIPNGTLYTFLNARALLREKPSTMQPQLALGSRYLLFLSCWSRSRSRGSL